MENFPAKKLILLFIILSVTITECDAQRYKRSIRNPERALFGKSLNTKRVKYREAPSIVRAKKKQAANKEKLDKEYKAIVKANRKHALEIQSTEVKTRILDNRKEADSKYKEKKKIRKENSRRAGKKYKY
jgi:LAS superfamily LD-carboxypeptidase LdcB